MSVTYTKLFSSITESTVWCEPASTRLVWITMLAMADRKGRVWASIPGLANRARVPLEDAESALATFLAPDKYSRTTDHDGRRIEPMDGGWALLNYAKYREMRDDEVRAEQNRTAQDRFRSKQKLLTVSHGQPPSAQAEAEAEADKEKIKDLSDKSDFAIWYAAYPRKEALSDARKAWASLKNLKPLAELLATLEWQKKHGCLQDIRADNRSLIPLPATYLRKGRWMDERPKDSAPSFFMEETHAAQ